MQHFPLMIPGAKGDGVLEISAPFDGSVIATAECASLNDAELALKTAYKLYRNRKSILPADKRIDILEKTIQFMKDDAEMLAIEAAREGGKPLRDSQVEVARAIDGIKICIETLRTQCGTEIPMNLNPASMGRLSLTSNEPIGVVVAISAFNHPLNLIVHQVCPAVAVGCPVIVKPAEDTPLSCFRLVGMLHKAGLPEEWCQALVVKDMNVAEKLVTDSRVAFLTFIGSAKVGWMLRSKLAPGTRCALEHGGVGPVILTEDADLDNALPLISKGGFYHAGQVCVSVQRVYAHSSIAEKFTDMLTESASKLNIGDPTLASTDIGPLIRTREVDRVEEWVKEAVDNGTKVMTGAERVSDFCYKGTVLYNPSKNLKVSQNEIFGPVVCVYPYNEMTEALDWANSLPYSFQASIFTSSIDNAMKAYKNLDAAAVMINDHTAFRVDWMPFAGLKQSGLGIGGIPYTMEDMQIRKLLVIKSNELY